MKRIISSILLCVLMLPLAFYCVTLLVHMLDGIGYITDKFAFIIASIAMVLIVCCIWLAVWQPYANMTRKRKYATLAALAAAIITSVSGGIYMEDFHARWVAGCLCFVCAFMVASAAAWRTRKPDQETRRKANSIPSELRSIVLCPTCNSDMTQLHELCCPGCGQLHTINGLLSNNTTPTPPATPQSTDDEAVI